MLCYFCEEHHPGGTNYGNAFAHGICKHCGVGVCREHSHREAIAGAPLLCLECTRIAEKNLAQTPKRVPDAQVHLN